MKDILGKEIVGYEEALYLKDMGFDGECTGYYHCDSYCDEEGLNEEDRYECVGWRGLFRNSFSLFSRRCSVCEGREDMVHKK